MQRPTTVSIGTFFRTHGGMCALCQTTLAKNRQATTTERAMRLLREHVGRLAARSAQDAETRSPWDKTKRAWLACLHYEPSVGGREVSEGSKTEHKQWVKTTLLTRYYSELVDSLIRKGAE